MWQRHDIVSPENLTKRFDHPELGRLQFCYTNLWLSPRTGVRMVSYTPADPETEALLARLDDIEPCPIELMG
jgi:hypothetical protein